MQGNVTHARMLTQPFKVKTAIVIREEYRLPIYATLNDMLRYARQMDARAARHDYFASATG